MISISKRSSFERAFVATGYLLDRRGDELLSALPEAGKEARGLAKALAAPERGARATVLAPELARLVQALQERRLG
jgi:hypothetical protein